MYKTVLVPVDVSDTPDTQKLLRAAKALTAGWDCTLHVTTVVPTYGMAIVGSYFDEKFEAESHKAAEAQLAKVIADEQIEAKAHVLSGKIYDTILNHADDIGADMIMIGAHQPGLRDYLLGPNAARIVRHSHQSVVVIRDPA